MGAGKPGDQREVRDETVHRTEDRWAQPAAGDVAVVVMYLRPCDRSARGGRRHGALLSASPAGGRTSANSGSVAIGSAIGSDAVAIEASLSTSGGRGLRSIDVSRP